MANVPATARVVVIGAGIVGNSLVHHLARLGWRDIVQLDKGALPNPGGSTGHASNFIFPVDHSREITDLTLDSVRQYQEMGVFTQSGGFELARTEERMEELRRRMSSAKAWGIEAELVEPGVREGEGPVHRDRPVHRRLLDPQRGRRGLAARGDDHARERPRDGCADRRTERRGHRPRHRGGRGRPPDHPAGAHHRRRHRGGVRRDRLRRVEPEDRRHGRDLDPADPRGAPDDQRRARARSCPGSPARSTSRSSATWTRSATSASTAPTWRSAPTRTARSCTSPRRSPRSSRPSSRRPRCRSPPTTSTPSSSRPTS